MFAPPPVHFSKVQIQRFKAEAEARKIDAEARKNQRESTESASSLTNIEATGLLRRTDSQSPRPRKGRLFTRNSKLKVSSPIAQSPKRDEAPTGQQQHSEGAKSESDADKKAVSPPPFAEQPRRAPVPPRRPSRTPVDLPLPPIPGPAPTSPPPAISAPPSGPPPPIPQKSPRRQGTAVSPTKAEKEERKSPTSSQRRIDHALAQLEMDFNPGSGRSSPSSNRPGRPTRSSTAPAAAGGGKVSNVFKKPPVIAKRSTVSGQPEESRSKSVVKDGKISKPAKRASAASSIRAALLEIDTLAMKPPRRTASPQLVADVLELAGKVSTSPSEMQLPWKRRRKGETISMLLDSGFFPVKQLTVGKGDSTRTVLIKRPPPLALIDRDLPDTPGSIMSTPTELYQTAPKVPLPITQRKTASKRRGPLRQISSTNARTNSVDRAQKISPTRLSAIPELARSRDPSPPSSGVTTPVATEIHLRNGSVLTVEPPELTAWERHEYIQGPIKLPKPVILPRKNSVASLEAFQEAIDKVYQEALVVPRRRSDDAVEEDVCEFFDDFGFEDVGLEGDMLGMDEIALDDIDEVQEMEDEGNEPFSTPPSERDAMLSDKAATKRVQDLAKPDPVPKPLIPPIENEETLRARGIARLSQQARKESLTLTHAETNVGATTPAFEESTLTAAIIDADVEDEEDEEPGQMVDPGGWSDSDPEELDEQSSWLAPAMLNRGRSYRETRNPVRKMRRFMASASAMI
ncbi:hypothetical protein B0A50_01807 [Salinomyces thailandicus]|uniref:Uncharacterized protein n=1 Tax=Salinomyces thailandicus TaxID=706561 RepID=A0A4V5N5G5_9PEZI|nr:hypothetical protein B0A50_01807 [Salinomyces thailandica]